jgi:hypothetical protein
MSRSMRFEATIKFGRTGIDDYVEGSKDFLSSFHYVVFGQMTIYVVYIFLILWAAAGDPSQRWWQ